MHILTVLDYISYYIVYKNDIKRLSALSKMQEKCNPFACILRRQGVQAQVILCKIFKRNLFSWQAGDNDRNNSTSDRLILWAVLNDRVLLCRL